MSGSTTGKARGGRAAKSHKAAPRQNLPQHQLPAPYSDLLGLGYGDFVETYDQTAGLLAQGDPSAAARRLLAMIQDESYYDYDTDDYPGGEGGDRRGWTRLHALRVLSRMGEAAHIGIEPLLPLLDSEDDYLREDAPFYYAAMGPPATPALSRMLADPTAPSYRRSGAGESLAEIGEKHPELHDAIVAVLEQALLAEKDDSALTGFIIISLCDLAAHGSMPVIEQAFQEDRVDETLVSLAEVQEHFGLRVTAERPRWEYGPGEPRRATPLADVVTPAEDETVQRPFVAEDKVGRNEPCPCGSGKKYKRCCGAAA